MSPRKYLNHQRKSNEYLSSSSPQILDIINDNDDDNEDDEYSNSQTKRSNSVTTDDEHITHQTGKKMKFKFNKKSHRLIEKRRRDRMNRDLEILLELIPHKKPENGRRIEKTEIIEMAVKYIRNLKLSNQKSLVDPIDLNRKMNLKIDAYVSGYNNGVYDIYEYTEKHFNKKTLLSDLIHFIKEKEIKLNSLTAVPVEKAKINFLKKSSDINSNNSCVALNPRSSEDHIDPFQFSVDDRQNSSPSNKKVPIFVLHPSGTHYIPMSIDLSIVSHVFNNKPQLPSINENPQCHPVSIPVNFSPISTTSDIYELDIQNINIIGTRHQTSVRPN